MAWVNLNDIYVPNTGGTITGDLNVDGAIVVNDNSGEGTTYNVANEITDLKDAWDSISQDTNSLLNDSGWINFMPTGSSETYSHYRKIGNLVIISLNYVVASGSWTQRFQMPEGFRPSIEIDSAIYYLAQGGYNGGARIRTDGWISTYGNMASPYWCGELVYFVD